MNYNICTLSDYRYLPQGLAMLNSLKKYNNINAYYLCLDDKSFEVLTKLQIKFIVPIHLKTLLERCKDLRDYKEKVKPELGGGNNNQFCWALASYFIDYLLNTEAIKDILYVDSDVYFYSSLKPIYDEINDKSVGIIKHRHNLVGNIDGAYNVGIIYFANNLMGKTVVKWWKEGILYDRYPEYSTCGDQKYLEGFIPNFGEQNICVIDEHVGHGAPWNFRLYVYENYEKNGTIFYGNKEQKLVFNHFSRIRIGDINKPWPNNLLDYTGGNYADHTLNFQTFLIPQVQKFYKDYIEEVKFMTNYLRN